MNPASRRRFFLRSIAPATALFTCLSDAFAETVEAAREAVEPVVQHMPREWQLNFQEAASPVMERLDNMHIWLLWVCVIVSLFVLAVTLYIFVKFNRKANPVPSNTTHNTMLEVIWTTIPILVLIAIAIPSVRAHYYMEKEPESGITLKVTGHQWYWSYEYPDHGGFGFDSYMLTDEDAKKAGKPRLLGVDNHVVVPVNTPVRVLLTGADVIHAFALPAFGVKRDAVPGRLNETWFEATKEGIYYGQCSELCGKLHGFMPIEIEVASKEKFDAWVAEQQKLAGIQPAGTEVTPASAAPTPAAQKKPAATVVKEVEPAAPTPADAPTEETPETEDAQ